MQLNSTSYPIVGKPVATGLTTTPVQKTEKPADYVEFCPENPLTTQDFVRLAKVRKAGLD